MERTQSLLTVGEACTVKTLKEEAIRHPQLTAILQEIISIFAAIRSQVAEATIDGSNHKISLMIDESNQLIQLHEEIRKEFKGFAKLVAVISKSPTATTNTKSVRIARQGFLYRESGQEAQRGNYQLNQKEFFTILKSFRDRLQAVAREIIRSNVQVSDAKLVS